jgi:DNA repair protein RadC
MPINHWPADERPREKLIAQGAGKLSDAELLAIFLRVGVTGKSAVDLARDLLTHFGGLTPLAHASVKEISTVHGMGEAKAVQLLAAVELSRRALAEQAQTVNVMDSPQVVRDHLRLTLGGLKHESFWVMYLSQSNQLIRSEELSRGTLTETAVYTRELIKRALELNCANIIIAHNHPGGGSSASASDRALTAKLRDALAMVDITLLDHFIVTPSSINSMLERGEM